jgi:hypothetical protein
MKDRAVALCVSTRRAAEEQQTEAGAAVEPTPLSQKAVL